MYRRTLSRDAVLWWQGDPAESVGVIEKGRIGIRVSGRLVDVFLSGMAFGEAALLATEGPLGRRAADIVVLEDDTVVVEHPVTALRGTMEAGVPRLILRTLIGQVARNQIIAASACPGNPVVESMVAGSLEALSRTAGRLEEVKAYEDFQAAFRYLFHLRDGSDRLRTAFEAAKDFSAAGTLALLERLRPVIGTSVLADDLERFLRAEASRLSPH
jgi:CRP-like cAMP-binding protein